MKCEFCGAENPDGATFCKACGKRIDNKTQCPSCHKTVPADSGFCIYCGADISAKQAAAPAAPVAPVAPAAKPKVDIILKWISVACAYAVAVISLICIFFIGVKVQGTDINTGYPVFENVSLTYFLGSGIDEMDSADSLISQLNLPSAIADLYTMPIAAGLLAALSLIIITCIFVILCSVNFIKFVKGKSFKSPCFYGLGAFFANAMAVSFMVFYFSDADPSLNAAAISSLVLGSILTLGSVGCEFARGGKPKTDKASVGKYSTAISGAIVCIVIAGVASLSTYSLKVVEEYLHISGSSSARSLMLLIYSSALSSQDIAVSDSAFDRASTYGLMTIVFTAAIIILSLFTARQYIVNYFTGKRKKTFSLNIALVCLSVALLIASLLGFNEYKPLVESGYGLRLSANCVAPICLLIISAIALANDCMQAFAARRLQAAAPAEQNSAAAQTPVATETPAEQVPVTAEPPVLAETSAADETPDGESEADFAAQKENAAADIDKPE